MNHCSLYFRCKCSLGNLKRDNRTCDFTGLIYYGTTEGTVVLALGSKKIRVKAGLLNRTISDVTHDFDKKIIFFSDISRNERKGRIGYFSLLNTTNIKFIHRKFFIYFYFC